jgi:hypothetical protein
MKSTLLLELLSGEAVLIPQEVRREVVLAFLSLVRGSRIAIVGANKAVIGKGIWYKASPKQLLVRVANLSAKILLSAEIYIKLVPLPMLMVGSSKKPRLFIAGLEPVVVEQALRRIVWNEKKEEKLEPEKRGVAQ